MMQRRRTYILTASVFAALNITAEAQNNKLCTVQMFNGQVMHIFEPFEVSCPNVGERATGSFDFKFADHQGNGTSTTKLSVALSHGSNGNYQRTEGLVAAADSFAVAGCPFFPAEVSDIDVNTWGATTQNLACNGELNDVTKLCLAFSYQGNSGKRASFGVIFMNTGTCEGNVLIEANIVDNAPSDDAVTSPCVSPIRPRCESSFAPTAAAAAAVSVTEPTISPGTSTGQPGSNPAKSPAAGTSQSPVSRLEPTAGITVSSSWALGATIATTLVAVAILIV